MRPTPQGARIFLVHPRSVNQRPSDPNVLLLKPAPTAFPAKIANCSLE
jgi:hypothetical protein